MSKTPRTDNFFAQTITMNSTDSLAGWLELSTTLETELADGHDRFVKAQAKIEQLNQELFAKEQEFNDKLHMASVATSATLAEARITSAARARIINKQTLELAGLRADIEQLKSESRRVTPAAMVFDNLQKELADKDRQLAEARADADHWKSECNALQRMAHEARAEIKLKNEELDMFWAEQQAMGEIIECKNKLIEQMLEALEDARLFIENGIEMGYISEPQPGTPESATLPAIKAAIKAAKGEV